MQQNHNLLDIVSVFWKWRKSIIIVTILAAILSAVISLLLPNYYKATTVFYPASNDLSAPQPLGYVDKNIRYFGNDHDRDRVFTISQSTDIADKIIDEYDLINRYGVDTTNHKWKHIVRNTFHSHYTIIKTKYDAIELSFEDQDPIIAAKVANAIRDQISQMNSSLSKSSQQNQLTTFQNSIKAKEDFLKTINDSIVSLRNEYGVYDLKNQTEILMTQITDTESNLLLTKAKLDGLRNQPSYQDSIPYYKANQSGYQNQLNQLKKKMNNYNQGYSSINNLHNEINQVSNQLSIDKERVKQLESSFDQSTLSLHVIEKASVPIIKSRPRRSLYVLASSIFVFGLTCLYVLLMHTYRSIAWKEVLKDE